MEDIMKSVMLSIKPKYCELIANGKKTIEVRKTRPKIETLFKCYVYCTKEYYRKGNGYFQGKYCGKVIGEFVCDEIINLFALSKFWYSDKILSAGCLSPDEIRKYAVGADKLYGWHISNLVIYNKPKNLSEFITIRALDYDDWHYGLYDGSVTCEDYLKQFKLKRPPQSWCYCVGE